MLCRTAALVAIALVAAGCAPVVTADPVPPAATPSATSAPTPTPRTDGRLVGIGLVLDDGDGPELCLGGVAQSLPPQCGGPPLVGWTWPKQGVERVSGTTWGGDYAVVGTYDGRRITVEKTVDPDAVRRPVPEERDFASPCPVPARGWRAPDPARATHETQGEAIQLAEQRPDYADAWIDDLGDPAQDPTKIVLNLRFTEDLAGAERAVRAVYGGNLCVSRAERTRTELMRIQEELMKLPGVLGSGPDDDVILLQVVLDDGTLQRTLDRKYGPGRVRVDSALQPYAE